MARTLLLGLAVLAIHHAACAAAALRSSAISAAPEHPLPRQPRHHSHSHSALPPAPAPALSPEYIMPLLPSPGEDDSAAPASDAVPTIQSTLSPPNPDALEPDSGYAPAVAAQSRAPAPLGSASVAWTLPVGLLLAMWVVV